MLLDAVAGFPLAAAAHIARVADQYVECLINRTNRIGARNDRVHVGQFQLQRRCDAGDTVASRLGFLQRQCPRYNL